MMKHLRITTRLITFVLSLIVLPLSALVCNWSPLGSQGSATATATPSPLLPLAPLAPSPTSTGGEFTLEFFREGSLSAGGVTINWGPDTAQIPLAGSNGAYTGSYSGSFKAAVSGTCSGAYTYPVTVTASAKEDEFEDLDFTVTTTMSMSGTLSCAPGPLGNAPVTFTRTFTLPAEDGASKVFNTPMQGGETTDTYTLKKQGP